MANIDNYEVETKIQVSNLAVIQQRLKAINAKLAGPRIFERNVRYENSDNSLTENGIVVRLRQDHRVRLTYKEPTVQTHDNVSRRFEAEVEVNDYNAMALILERLGYHPFLIYEKYRTTYHYNETEIVLDEMPYGNFVEVEGQPEAIEQTIRALKLEREKRLNTNYLALFDTIKARLGLSFHDLTFQNFEGIQIPTGAFK